MKLSTSGEQMNSYQLELFFFPTTTSITMQRHTPLFADFLGLFKMYLNLDVNYF